MTSRAFEALGISRKALHCPFEMEGLDEESEHAVIRDWLVKDGNIKGGADAWIDNISRETYGWPQHVWIYTDAAVRQLRKSDGEMTAEGLELVLKEGCEGRVQYYKGRASGIKPRERRVFVEVFQDIPEGAKLEDNEIIEPLAKRFGQERAEEVFYTALSKGFLYEDDETYGIPVPSMWNWLKENFPPKKVSSQKKEEDKRIDIPITKTGNPAKFPVVVKPPQASPPKDVSEKGQDTEMGLEWQLSYPVSVRK